MHEDIYIYYILCLPKIIKFFSVFSSCFFPWHKTQQKGLNIAKELGAAVPHRSLMSKLKSSQLTEIFWTKLMDFER